MKCFKYLAPGLVAVLILSFNSIAFARPGDENLLIAEDFESGGIDYDEINAGGSYDGQWYYDGNKIGPWRAVENNISARGGRYYMKSSIGSDIAAMSGASNTYRTELRMPSRKRLLQQNWEGSEFWIGFSVYLPSSEFKIMPDGGEWQRDIIYQWHNNATGGEGAGNNPIGIGTDYSSKGVLEWRGDFGWQESPGVWGADKPFWGPVELDTWVDWIIHVVFDWRSNGNGRMEIWKGINGKYTKLRDYTGPTTYDHTYGPYQKLGIYHGWWRPDLHPEDTQPLRTVYHDEFRLGDGSANFDMVAPEGNSRDVVGSPGDSSGGTNGQPPIEPPGIQSSNVPSPKNLTINYQIQ